MTTPIPHRCAGLPDGTRAYLTALPQGDRVQVYYDTADGMDCLARAFGFCPGCGRPADYIRTVERAAAWLEGRRPLPFSDPSAIEGWIGDKHYPAVGDSHREAHDASCGKLPRTGVEYCACGVRWDRDPAVSS